MADADPFVKRMLARSEARRAMLAKLGGESKAAPKLNLDKENIPQGDKSHEVLSACRHKGSLNKAPAEHPLTDKNTPEQENQNVRTASPPPATPVPSSPIKSHLESSSSKLIDAVSSQPSVTYVSKSPTKSTTILQNDLAFSRELPQECVPSSSRAAGKGLKALARRQQQMQQWEDDYAYHSANTGSKVSSKSCSSASVLHGSTGTSNTNLTQSRLLNSSVKISKPASSNENASSCKADQIRSDFSASDLPPPPPPPPPPPAPPSFNMHAESRDVHLARSDSPKKTTPTYHYGERPVLSPKQKQAIELKLHRPKVVCTDLDQAASTKVLPTSGPAGHCRDMSPATKLFWDRKLISSLEAQGFTPESQSRLVYQFKKEQEELKKEQEDLKKEQTELKKEQEELKRDQRVASPSTNGIQPACPSLSKSSSVSECSSAHQSAKNAALDTRTNLEHSDGAPKVLSCVLKSVSDDDAASSSSRPSRTRDASPTSVERLRSRWEQQIRDSSPDRQQTRARSCSPTKPLETRTFARSGSPSKPLETRTFARSGSPSKPLETRTFARSGSPTKPLETRTFARSGSPSKPLETRTIARSGSPSKPLETRTFARSGSPSKQGCGPSEGPHSGYGGAHKPHSNGHAVSRDRSPSPVKTLGASSTCLSGGVTVTSGTSYRSRSPLKQSVSAGVVTRDVVKGVCPMPEAVPLLDEPHQSSVKARAAAFNSVMAAPAETCLKKDPAELSVQGRRQIFERRGEDALLPKAPFGQPVPAKMLQNNNTPATLHGSNKQSGLTHHPASSAHHAPSSGGGTVSKYRDALEIAAATEGAACTEDAWQQQKHREMEALRNRFSTAPPAYTPRAADGLDYTDSEYAESDYSFEKCETASSTASEHYSPGPPKPPRTYADALPPYPDNSMPPPPLPPSSASSNQSPSKRNFEPHVKPGCLYPGLSDIESMSDVEHQQNESAYSSEGVEDATCVSMDSLGTKIQQIARHNREPQPQPMHVLREDEEEAESIDACSDTSAALDEAFSDDSTSYVTPPKRHRDEQSEAETHHNQYKTPRISTSPSRPAASGEHTPLSHSISMYRKQRPAEVSYTPVRQIIQRPGTGEITSPATPAVPSPSVVASEKIKFLNEMESKELRIMQQAYGAVSVAEQRLDHLGDTHHIEAEKLLLLSTQRRLALLAEIQRLKAEASSFTQSWADDHDVSLGCITISNITLPLSHDFLKRGINEVDHHVLVLVKQQEKVLNTCVQSTPSCVVNGTISFPSNFTLDNLKPDFSIIIEAYVFKIPASAGSSYGHLKKDQSRMKLTPLKRLQHQQRSDRGSPATSSGPSPGRARASAFTLMGATTLSISALCRTAWDLEKAPPVSPFSGHLVMQVQVRMEGGVSGRGFLTVFQDVGGLGAWTRRWAVLDGPALKFWSYPDQENKQKCVQFVPLKLVSTRRVELVSRDVCARPHTFLVTTVRPTEAGDTNSLVTEVAANTTITKLLLSADSSEERVEWCRKLNVALTNIRAWDPQATRPDHYHV
ncbi:Anillin domain [Trinorchestia longiramus]|nr:Anillin domain [Trinorchestia longiramus]